MIIVGGILGSIPKNLIKRLVETGDQRKKLRPYEPHHCRD